MKKKKLLELNNVSKQFTQGGEKINALKKTNFSIFEGEFVALVGPSGSGKSTFLTIAGGLQTPSSGQVIIDGIDISKMKQKALSKVRLEKIGFILQASNLVPFLKVNDQLKLHDKVINKKTNESIRQDIFKGLGIEKLTSKYPRDLSGGEKQRVAIAKVLYSGPNLILADEPTASLDTVKAFEVVELLLKETHDRNKATIMVTHDERLLKYCDRVFEMVDGSLKERKNKST